MGFSMELASAINEMVNIEYTNIANAIRFGIESGEVRECDVPTAVHFIATAIASFVVISSVDPSCDLYKGVEYGYLKKYTPEDVYDLIMNGLHA